MTTPEQPPKEATPAKPSMIAGLLRILLPAIFAAGAAYGGARGAAAHPPLHKEEKPQHQTPGPTVALEPFLVTLHDANHKPHPMKMTVAIEFHPKSQEDYKPYVPRLRDALLVHVRSLSYEEVIDSAHGEKLRTELLERCKSAGASGAEKILITDFVIQ